MSSGEFASWLAALVGALTYLGLIISWVKARREFPKVLWHIFELGTHTKSHGNSEESFPYFRLSNIGIGTGILTAQYIVGGERIHPEDKLPESIFSPASHDQFPIKSSQIDEAWMFLLFRSSSDRRYLYLTCLPLKTLKIEPPLGRNVFKRFINCVGLFYNMRYGSHPPPISPGGLLEARIRIAKGQTMRVDRLMAEVVKETGSGSIFN